MYSSLWFRRPVSSPGGRASLDTPVPWTARLNGGIQRIDDGLFSRQKVHAAKHISVFQHDVDQGVVASQIPAPGGDFEGQLQRIVGALRPVIELAKGLGFRHLRERCEANSE